MTGGATVFDGEQPRQLPFYQTIQERNAKYERRWYIASRVMFGIGCIIYFALCALAAAPK